MTYLGLCKSTESVNAMAYCHVVEGRKKREIKIYCKSYFLDGKHSDILSIY